LWKPALRYKDPKAGRVNRRWFEKQSELTPHRELQRRKSSCIRKLRARRTARKKRLYSTNTNVSQERPDRNRSLTLYDNQKPLGKRSVETPLIAKTKFAETFKREGGATTEYLYHCRVLEAQKGTRELKTSKGVVATPLPSPPKDVRPAGGEGGELKRPATNPGWFATGKSRRFPNQKQKQGHRPNGRGGASRREKQRKGFLPRKKIGRGEIKGAGVLIKARPLVPRQKDWRRTAGGSNVARAAPVENGYYDTC